MTAPSADLATPAAAAAASGPRLWRRATLWLAGLGAFFYAGYPLTNWLASLRRDVPVVVFGWESAVPFLAWTIVPYWTTNLFFVLSLYVCRTRRELDVHARRLLSSQAIAFVFFIAVPLRASFVKPATDGVAGFLFASLGAFDRPFNQAPSLHVALTTVLAALYVRVLPRWAGIAFLSWSLLVVASVLTTYQHHFIDIPTGFLLGLLCIWMWPWEGGNRLAGWRTTRDVRRRELARRYAIAAAALGLLAATVNGAALWLLWPAVALAAVAAAYLGLGPPLFAKSPDGRLDWASRLVLLPYLAGARLNAYLWTRRDAARVEIADGVSLGRFPSRAECRHIATVVDTTCEFGRPPFSGEWVSLPMLDLVEPDATTLRAAADRIEVARARGAVLVCCALGYGRSAATLAVWLVRSGRQADLEAAVDHLRAKRPRLAINPDQRRAMAEAIDAA
jgi:protein-tyrosine phosphatase/membrane-associated phospholipid phosphatase